MSKQFTVTMTYMTPAGKRVRFVGNVATVPGVDVFRTARDVAPKMTRKGQVARVVRASAVAI